MGVLMQASFPGGTHGGEWGSWDSGPGSADNRQPGPPRMVIDYTIRRTPRLPGPRTLRQTRQTRTL